MTPARAAGGGARGDGRRRPVRIVVADAQPLFAESLGEALAARGGFEVLGEFPSDALAAVEVIRREKPDVALLDYWMPDMEGAAAVALVRKRQPARRIILVSWFHGPQEIDRAMAAGAVGFFPKNMRLDRVAEGIRRAYDGESPVFAEELGELHGKISERGRALSEVWDKLAQLTQREIGVLVMLSLDLPVGEAAKQLSVAPGTLKVHIRNMMSKTGARSHAEMVAMARACGFIRT